MNEQLRQSKHFPALDGLRGLAILLVILHNADASSADGWTWPLNVTAHAGWIGVQLFFVLSGFLITSNLLDAQGSTNYFRSFFARRVLRIFPLYFGVLFAALVVLPTVVSVPADTIVSHDNQVWLWAFLVNWTQPFGHGVQSFPHFWSLAVEEQFYLLWPFLVHERSSTRVWQLCLLAMAAAFVIRCAMVLSNAKPEMVYMFTVCRMDALAAGAACAALLRTSLGAALVDRHSGVLWMIGSAIVLAGALATGLYAIYDVRTLTAGHTLLSVGFALLVLGGVAPANRFNSLYQQLLSHPVLRSIGKYSYGIYVFHMPIIVLLGEPLLPHLRQIGSVHALVYPLTIGLLSYCVALASYRFYESQFLKLKRHFVPSNAARIGELGIKQSST